MIQTSDQYEFIYRCLVEYLDHAEESSKTVRRAPPPPVRKTSVRMSTSSETEVGVFDGGRGVPGLAASL